MGEPGECGGGECPICFNEFGRGARTVVCPFECNDHAICRACDATMYRRHDDRCPVCRAPRLVSAARARHGARAPGVPVHERDDGGRQGFGHMFFPIADSADVGLFDVNTFPDVDAFVHHTFQAPAVAAQRARRAPRGVASTAGMVVLNITNNANADNDADTASDSGDNVEAEDGLAVMAAAVEAALNESRTRAALDGLCDPTSMNLATFGARVRGIATSLDNATNTLSTRHRRRTRGSTLRV